VALVKRDIGKDVPKFPRRTVGYNRWPHPATAYAIAAMQKREVRHCDGAPAASQAARIWRSCAVIAVTLPGGMAFERTALISIGCEWRRMLSGSSSTAPLGGACTPGHTGSLRWHMLQRVRIALCAALMSTRSARGAMSAGPAPDSHATAIIPAAA